MSGRRTGLRAAGLVIVVAIVAGVGAGVAIQALNSGGGSSSAHDNPPGLHGQATWNPGERPAPDFLLPDQNGRPVSLGSLHGRTVILAFFSSRCRRACAPEVRSLRTALLLLPRPLGLRWSSLAATRPTTRPNRRGRPSLAGA